MLSANNYYEAEHLQSKAEFTNKMNIALKEANETDYWLVKTSKENKNEK